ncbi:MAG: helix-turn-helix domain-containing protein [Synergistaceae bacterium]|nr:helix-turn-helix domain-containing protein [Synergistaceae bacterium]
MEGKRLKALRESAGFTSKEDFAKKIGVALNTLYRWESGTREPDSETMLKLARLLNTSVSYLVGEIDYSGPLGHFDQERDNINKKGESDVIRIPMVGDAMTPDGKMLAIESYFP